MQLYARYDEHHPNKKQLLKEHSDHVGNLSVTLGFKELQSVQKLLGMLHDFGKASKTWQNYLFSETDSRKEKVPHSPHGAYFLKELNEKYLSNHTGNKNLSRLANILCLCMQFVIYAHHGIFDAISMSNYENIIQKRNEDFLKKYGEIYENAKKNFLQLYKEEDLQCLYDKAVGEYGAFFEKLGYIGKNSLSDKKNLTQLYFDLGFITKMLLSTLIDSDWTDSASFFDIEKDAWKKIKEKFSFEICLNSLEERMSEFKEDGEISKIRKQISLECKRKALELTETSGVYRLDLPTGAGKTLSVMRFSLIHAIKNKKDRIFYIAPFNSILEQNATQYKQFLLPEDGCSTSNNDMPYFGDYFILEHYGDVMSEKTQQEDRMNAISNYLIESWSSPIILTSMVQLLLTLFSAKSHSIRRLHSLYNSVIIIDEFQSVPINSTGLFNLAVNALAHLFDATVILTTATQPPFWNRIESNQSANKIPEVVFSKHPDLVRDYSNHPVFKRVDIKMDALLNERGRAIGLKNYYLEDLVQKIDQSMKEYDSVLVVLNTRESVSQLYLELNRLQESLQERDFLVFGLSNNMYKEHRTKVLDRVRELLKSNREIKKTSKKKETFEKTNIIACNTVEKAHIVENIGLAEADRTKPQKLVLVSTPLIEAGVDISFEFGIRSLSALHTIVQTAGRINRNGELQSAELLVIQVDKKFEKTNRMKSVALSKEILPALLYDFHDMPQKYGNRLDGKEAVNQFFEKYYSNMVEDSHYPVSLDDREYKLTDMLSLSRLHQKEEEIGKRRVKELNQAFKTAGEQYKPIGEEQIEVLVQHEGGKEIAETINAFADQSFISYQELKTLLKQASKYSIGMRRYLVDKMVDEGKIFEIHLSDHKIYVLRVEHYGEIGLIQADQAINDFIF